MEPITLCGLVIVIFCGWVECEAVVRAFGKILGKRMLFSDSTAHSTVQKPEYLGRLPLCFAKGPHG